MHKNLYIARKEQRMTQERQKLINIAQRTYQSKEQGRHDFTLKEAQN